MAEIRKFDPEAGNAIAQALKAAMGEPVRPAEPGARSEPARSEPTPPAAVPPTVVTFSVKAVVPPQDDAD